MQFSMWVNMQGLCVSGHRIKSYSNQDFYNACSCKLFMLQIVVIVVVTVVIIVIVSNNSVFNFLFEKNLLLKYRFYQHYNT